MFELQDKAFQVDDCLGAVIVLWSIVKAGEWDFKVC